MSVFRIVPVGRGLARHYGHEPHLGVLLLDQVFARFAFHLAAEEELEPAVERIPRHRVFGAEQLGGEPQPGADEAPGRGRLADHGGAVVGLELDHDAREVLRRGLGVVHVLPHLLLQFFRVRGTGPLEARDVPRHAGRAHGSERRVGRRQQVLHHQ